MQTSEDQFQELMAHLVARGNKALGQQSSVPPISLLLRNNGEVECSVGVADSPDELKAVLDAMQSALRERVRRGDSLAICVAYTDPTSRAVVALLENHENYCATVTVPCHPTSLDVENMQVDDGSVSVYSVVSDS
jgi:hypothetical protein